MPGNLNATSLTSDILIVDDEIPNLQLLTQVLSDAGYQSLRSIRQPKLAIESAMAKPPSLILLDVSMPEMNGFEVCRHLKQETQTSDIPIIFVSALQDVQDRVQGFEAGGVDFISKPFQEAEILARVRIHLALHNFQLHLEDLVAKRTAELTVANKALESEINQRQHANHALKQAYDEIRKLKYRLEAENLTLKEELRISFEDNELIGKSHAFQKVLQQVDHVAPTDSTVLILGETGTGKGLIARRIHHLSGRKDRPLINVNCAALPATLIESEFFGHEKGSFTGAIENKIGRFELADGGTIFLDEIGDLPIELQAKLLRVLQDQEFERIGSSITRTADTRVIAATNRDLDALIKQGAFRADLYYRLGVIPIYMPPLRERRGDISMLVWFFITTLQPRLGKTIESISSTVMDALTAYDWPGNVRELRNVVERAMILSPGASLELIADLPIDQNSTPAITRSRVRQSAKLEEVERAHIVSVLEACGWKVRGKDGAAERLGLKRSTLQSRMKKLGIQRPSS
ncbi:MAG: sigma-54 dependent transcriptional regulator [Desulfobacterales bacterium]|nr:sigma-54 dependent transcriptional regulator [Desulfobacterales bacterium]MDJ0915148.1 sigma-54 dependent transcriptional regulator [Desulfobacterales bacterium]